MKNVFKPRKLKVYTQCQQRESWGCYVQVPKIQLAGKWLDAAGFTIGDNVDVNVSEDCIVIRINKEQSSINRQRRSLLRTASLLEDF